MDVRRGVVLGTFASFALAMGLGVTACEAPPPPPSPFYYFRVMWNDNASTTATVGWSSVDAPSADQKLYYDTIDHGTDVSKYAYTQAISASNTAFKMNNVFARLKELQPATAYYFVISDSKNTSERYWFSTASNDPTQRVSIIAGGDSRNNRTPRQAANSLVAKIRPDAVMFGGDMTDSGTEAEWKYWFQDWSLTFSKDGRITPLIVARGNHERNNDILVNLYDTPAGVYYGVDLGGDLARIYTLNSEAAVTGAQTAWLKSDMASHARTNWKLAHYHVPMRPHVKSKPNGDTHYAAWAPLFHQYRMDIAVECDSHSVKATWPVRPSNETGSNAGFIRDDRTGTVYLGEGGWGAPLRSNNDIYPWTRDSDSFNHFQWIFISPRELEIRVVKVDNAAQVTELTDDTRFQIPQGIELWNPPNGEVVKLAK
jgi:hypothetical protein